MGRVVLTILGLAIVGVAATLIARAFVRPTQEKVEQSQEVLTKAYEPRVIETNVLEDGDIRELGLVPPAVGQDYLFLSVLVLYPGAVEVPEAGEHYLDQIDGKRDTRIEPVKMEIEEGEEGMYLFLVFRTGRFFESARLLRAGKVLDPNLQFG